MFHDGIYAIGDGLLDIDEKRLNGLLVQDDINEFYDVEQTPFARGKFAAVRRAIHKKSGVHFAAKFLKRRRRAQSSDKEIKHEIAVLMLCSGSDNIVKLNAVHESRSDTALLLELATGGELQALLDNEGSLTEAQARICLREVLKALKFLHNKSIAHLDLKPQNILLNGERVEDGLKLCDFGISRLVENGSKVREILGTPDYVAPEVLQYEPLSLQTDIWSVGVLTYVLLSGFSPFGGDSKQETFLNISQCALTFPEELFEGVSDQALDFIRSTLRIKPNDRLTALECLEHVWLKDECTINRKYLNISAATSDGASDEDNLDDYDEDEEEEEDEEENHLPIVEANSQKSSCSNNSSSSSNSTIKLNGTRLSSSTTSTDDCDKENSSNNSQSTNTNAKTVTTTAVISLNAAATTPQSSSTTTVTTTVNICLFPDAPTTPKVIRKAPSTDSATSVKALVKKFQLESNGDSTLLLKEHSPSHHNSHHHHHKNATTNSSFLVCSRNGSSTEGSSVSSNTNSTSSGGAASSLSTSPPATSYKSSCVFCLSCGGPGCRHSGNHVASKTSTNNLCLDQGIIC